MGNVITILLSSYGISMGDMGDQQFIHGSSRLQFMGEWQFFRQFMGDFNSDET